ncbi:MAG: YetF domain-containing protein [Acidimicrobiales bacterium]
MIHGDTSLPVGLASAVTLLVLNRLLTLLLLRSRRLRHLVNGGPILLVNHGRALDEPLRRAGLTSADLAEALRSQGYDGPADVRAAVLETDGTISVIPDRR